MLLKVVIEMKQELEKAISGVCGVQTEAIFNRRKSLSEKRVEKEKGQGGVS